MLTKSVGLYSDRHLMGLLLEDKTSLAIALIN